MNYENYWGGLVFAPFTIVLGAVLLYVVLFRFDRLGKGITRQEGPAGSLSSRRLPKVVTGRTPAHEVNDCSRHSLIPVKLSAPHLTDRQTGRSDSLHLPPPTGPVHLAEPRQLSDGASGGNGLDVGDDTDELEPPARHRMAYAMKSAWRANDWGPVRAGRWYGIGRKELKRKRYVQE